jgi:cytochrome c oxidase subunit 2
MNKLYAYAGAVLGAVSFAASAYATEGGGLPDPAEGWNILWHHLLVDIGAIGVVFALVTIAFMALYGRKRDDQEGDLPIMSMGTSLAWVLVPVFLFMADDFYLAANGWKLWNDQRHVPDGSIEVKGSAGKWYWEFTYDNGTTLYNNSFFVPKGKPVVVRSDSVDVIHSLFVPDYRIKEDVMPGRITFIWFNPVNEGSHVLTCTEYCGVGHSNMFGKVIVVPEDEYDAGLEDGFAALSAKHGV